MDTAFESDKDENNSSKKRASTSTIDYNSDDDNSSSAQEVLAVAAKAPAQHGSISRDAVVRIKHVATGRRLHSHNIKYYHGGSSKQQQVTAFKGRDDNDLWVVKGSMKGQPGNYLRLLHKNTKSFLHSHKCPSPATKQHEVTCHGSPGKTDSNSNWRIEGNFAPGGKFKLIHINTKHALHSHNLDFKIWQNREDRQGEVTCYGNRDNNDWWTIEEIVGPAATTATPDGPRFLVVGDRVACRDSNNRTSSWFAGKVTSIDISSSTCQIKCDDGDVSKGLKEDEVMYFPDCPPGIGKSGRDRLNADGGNHRFFKFKDCVASFKDASSLKWRPCVFGVHDPTELECWENESLTIQAGTDVVVAWYGDSGNASARTDVTAKVSTLVGSAGGSASVNVAATNAMFGDPALGIRKRLHVELNLTNNRPVATTAKLASMEINNHDGNAEGASVGMCLCSCLGVSGLMLCIFLLIAAPIIITGYSIVWRYDNFCNYKMQDTRCMVTSCEFKWVEKEVDCDSWSLNFRSLRTRTRRRKCYKDFQVCSLEAYDANVNVDGEYDIKDVGEYYMDESAQPCPYANSEFVAGKDCPNVPYNVTSCRTRHRTWWNWARDSSEERTAIVLGSSQHSKDVSTGCDWYIALIFFYCLLCMCPLACFGICMVCIAPVKCLAASQSW